MVDHLTSARAEHEIAYGKKLAEGDPDLIWGWGTPAGRLRARRRSELIANGDGLREGVRALEIGCGTGTFTRMLAETGSQLVAMDVSPDLIEKAQARGLPPDQVKFMVKRFEGPDSAGPFDAVIGSSVLHHLNIEDAPTKIYALLKPGGLRDSPSCRSLQACHAFVVAAPSQIDEATC